MPLTYPSSQSLAYGPSYTQVNLVRVLIDAPVGGPETVTLTWEARNGNSKVVARRELTVAIDDPDLTSDTGYLPTQATIKRVGYNLAPRAGFATGGKVT